MHRAREETPRPVIVYPVSGTLSIAGFGAAMTRIFDGLLPATRVILLTILQDSDSLFAAMLTSIERTSRMLCRGEGASPSACQ